MIKLAIEGSCKMPGGVWYPFTWLLAGAGAAGAGVGGTSVGTGVGVAAGAGDESPHAATSSTVTAATATALTRPRLNSDFTGFHNLEPDPRKPCPQYIQAMHFATQMLSVFRVP